MNFQIKSFDPFAFADSENAIVDGECEALELDRPGFLSQLRLSISCMVEEKEWQLPLTELLGLQYDACLVGNIKACHLSPTVYCIG